MGDTAAEVERIMELIARLEPVAVKIVSDGAALIHRRNKLREKTRAGNLTPPSA